MGNVHSSALALGLIVALAGGGASAAPRPRAAPQTRPVAATRPAKGQVSQEHARAFASSVEAAVAKGDGSVLAGAIDASALMDTVLAGLEVSPATAADARLGAAKAVNQLSDEIARNTQTGGSYRLLRVHGDGAGRRALFRMVNTDGLNYHDMHLAAGEDGRVRVIDMDVIVSGEPLSQTLRRLLMPLIADENRGRIAKLLGKDSELSKHLPDIARAQRFMKNGNAAEALAIFDALPQGVRGEKIVMLYRLMCAAKLEGDTYVKALAEYDQKFPDDPSGLLLRLDALFLANKFDELLVAVERLEKRIGGDPYLDVFRANAHAGKGEAATGRKLLARLLKAEPALQQPYYLAIDLALADKDFAAVADLMFTAEERAGIDWDPAQVETVEGFGEYVKSPHYRRWLERHNQRERQQKVPPKPDAGR